MEADISQTHPPSRIKVAFGQGFVIISIRIREGPLRHDARNEPAEQGKKRIYVEIRAKAALRRRKASARGTTSFQSLGHCAVLAVRVDPWPPAAQPSGCGTSAKGLPGLPTHRDEGVPFCTPRSHSWDFKQLLVHGPKALYGLWPLTPPPPDKN